GRADRADVLVRAPLRSGDRRAPGRRSAERGRPEPGPLPIRLRRTNGRRLAAGAGSRGCVDERHDVERTARDQSLGLELADRRPRDRPGARFVPASGSGTGPRTGSVDLTLQAAAENTLQPLRGRDERVQVDAGLDAFTGK